MKRRTKQIRQLFSVCAAFLVSGAMLTACQDDERYDWDGQRANLICTLNNNAQSRWTEPGATTRGQRITGEAFSNGIRSLGIYGKVGATELLNGVKYSIGTTDDEFQFNEDPWFTKEVDLNFPGEGGWPSEDKGYFYGYAPYPGNADDEAKCYTVDFSGSVPTMTFTMQADEADNKDIIDAKNEGISRGTAYSSGIELQFRHVLSALKFKFDDTNVKARVDGTDYYIQLKAVKLIGIYSEGTAPIGGTLDASLWSPKTTTADCAINTSLSWTDLTAAANKASDGKCYLNNDTHCLLVLPQTAPTGAKIAFKCDLTTDADGTDPYMSDITIEASLAGLQWLPGRSYTYTLGQTNTTSLWVSPGVMSWQVADGSITDLNLDYGTTSLSFDMFYYRYDAVDLDSESDSYVMISDGTDGDGRPLRSPFMTCNIELGAGLDKVVLESSNGHFQFVTATETTDPDHPVAYTTSSSVEVTSSNTRLHYYVVPTSSATAGETAEVRMIGYKSDTKVAVLPYNADVMPGLKPDNHAVIRYKYFSTDDYDNAGSNPYVRTEMAQ